MPAASVAELALEVRDAGDAPGELPFAGQAVQFADAVVRRDHERSLPRLEDLRDGLDRRHLVLAVEVLVELHRLDGFRCVHVADEGDAVRTHAVVSGTALRAVGPAEDAVLVVADPGALTPAQPPHRRDARSGWPRGGLLPSFQRFGHRPARPQRLRRFDAGRIGHLLVFHQQRAGMHHWGAIEHTAVASLLIRLGKTLYFLVGAE